MKKLILLILLPLFGCSSNPQNEEANSDIRIENGFLRACWEIKFPLKLDSPKANRNIS